MIKLTSAVAFTYTKFTLLLVGLWPPGRNATKLKIVLFKITWLVSWLFSLSLAIPLAYTAYDKLQSNVIIATKSLCLSLACIQCTVRMYITKAHNHRLEVN